ncbi:MAG: hypothetical protein HYY02_10710 [Chloroflexi bacterium]|nr:hypothetical protein [Chloroflexota bacterium]
MPWTPELGVIRTIRPTDLVALVAFEGKAVPNCALTRHRLERDHERPLAMSAFFNQWVTLEDRHTLVASEGHSIRGLVSARHRAGPTAWEVDWLVLGHEEEEPTAVALLEHLADVATAAGVQRLFLRLPQDSALIPAARRAGFWPYLAEGLYRRQQQEAAPAVAPIEGLRPKVKGDEQGIFRLYHAAVPQGVRAVEGMTLREWNEVQDARFGRRREFVCLREDQLCAWLWVALGSECGQFQVLVHPGQEELLSPLVGFALSRLARKQTVLALVPEFQSGLQTTLVQEWDFEAGAHYHTLVRQLTVRVKEGRLVLARA